MQIQDVHDETNTIESPVCGLPTINRAYFAKKIIKPIGKVGEYKVRKKPRTMAEIVNGIKSSKKHKEYKDIASANNLWIEDKRNEGLRRPITDKHKDRICRLTKIKIVEKVEITFKPIEECVMGQEVYLVVETDCMRKFTISAKIGRYNNGSNYFLTEFIHIDNETTGKPPTRTVVKEITLESKKYEDGNQYNNSQILENLRIAKIAMLPNDDVRSSEQADWRKELENKTQNLFISLDSIPIIRYLNSDSYKRYCYGEKKWFQMKKTEVCLIKSEFRSHFVLHCTDVESRKGKLVYDENRIKEDKYKLLVEQKTLSMLESTDTDSLSRKDRRVIERGIKSSKRKIKKLERKIKRDEKKLEVRKKELEDAGGYNSTKRKNSIIRKNINIKKGPLQNKSHLFILPNGEIQEIWPLNERNVWATKAESKKVAKKRMFHVELDYEYAATQQQYEHLADVYIKLCQSDGYWLIIVPHIEVDRGIPKGHSDATNFDYNKFYQILIDRKVPMHRIPKFSHSRYHGYIKGKVVWGTDRFSWPPKLEGDPHYKKSNKDSKCSVCSKHEDLTICNFKCRNGERRNARIN